MKIDINWNTDRMEGSNRIEVEANLRAEVESAYEYFEIKADQATISLHHDAVSETLLGVVIGHRGIDMTLTYSLVEGHTTTYVQRD